MMLCVYLFLGPDLCNPNPCNAANGEVCDAGNCNCGGAAPCVAPEVCNNGACGMYLKWNDANIFTNTEILLSCIIIIIITITNIIINIIIIIFVLKVILAILILAI